jgi:hypothetical protein
VTRGAWIAWACAACGACAPVAAPIASAPPPVAPPHISVPPPVAAPPLQVTVIDASGSAHGETWRAALGSDNPSEDVGAFAYARRKTTLHAGDVAVGWLEPGARVGVIAATADRAEVALFAWTDASLDGRAHAWVNARDLGPAAPPDAPPFAPAVHPEKLVAHGQYFLRSDGAKYAFTFCGAVESLGGDRVRQREDGVVLDGRLAPDVTWQSAACPGLLVVSTTRRPLALVYHERERAYAPAAWPPGLVAAGPFAGATFAQLVAKRAKVYWLVDDRNAGPTCEEWVLAPPKTHDSGDAAIVTHVKLSGGETAVGTFGLVYGTVPDTSVTLLGPSWQQYSPQGNPTSSSSFGCGMEYAIVASADGALVMLADPPELLSHVLAYDPRDTERWYLDRARCERDAAAKRQLAALAFGSHHGCDG